MDDCAVCYEKVSESTGHCTLSCKHSFHIACLTRWSVETPNCPMCRNPLSVTEAPAKRPVENWMFSGGQPRVLWDIVQQIQQELGPEPVQPPPPPRPPQDVRIINIGDGVQVSEGDVALVMEHAHVTRGEAVRALRRYDGDIVNSILMLTSPDAVVPRVPVARDPMVEASDDQATAWFLQLLFEGEGYPWNSYSDMRWRMNNGMRTHKFWVHREFQIEEEGAKLDAGYNSA
jgi:hypothetical protein